MQYFFLLHHFITFGVIGKVLETTEAAQGQTQVLQNGPPLQLIAPPPQLTKQPLRLTRTLHQSLFQRIEQLQHNILITQYQANQAIRIRSGIKKGIKQTNYIFIFKLISWVCLKTWLSPLSLKAIIRMPGNNTFRKD